IFISKLGSVLSQRKSGNHPKVTSRTDVQSKVIQAPELKPFIWFYCHDLIAKTTVHIPHC
ncbi:TPA: hypothetical protein ACIVIB_000412, partial [Salmonella enterica subsp. enterica serovar Waycross]